MILFKPYDQLLLNAQNNRIPYSILLTATEWRDKRENIIKRENNICQICKCMDDMLMKISNNFIISVPATYEEIEEEIDHLDIFGQIEFTYKESLIRLVEQSDPKIPHVHHTYYIKTQLPWEYPDEDLMLVCHNCHSNIHQNEKIKVYNTHNKNELCDITPCSKCNGTGYLNEYSYWKNGVCFECGGNCFKYNRL